MNKLDAEIAFKAGWKGAIELKKGEHLNIPLLNEKWNEFWEKQSATNDLIIAYFNAPPEIRQDIIKYAEFLVYRRKGIQENGK